MFTWEKSVMGSMYMIYDTIVKGFFAVEINEWYNVFKFLIVVIDL